jgi:hypothetical protein
MPSRAVQLETQRHSVAQPHSPKRGVGEPVASIGAPARARHSDDDIKNGEPNASPLPMHAHTLLATKIPAHARPTGHGHAWPRLPRVIARARAACGRVTQVRRRGARCFSWVSRRGLPCARDAIAQREQGDARCGSAHRLAGWPAMADVAARRVLPAPRCPVRQACCSPLSIFSTDAVARVAAIASAAPPPRILECDRIVGRPHAASEAQVSSDRLNAATLPRACLDRCRGHHGRVSRGGPVD